MAQLDGTVTEISKHVEMIRVLSEYRPHCGVVPKTQADQITKLIQLIPDGNVGYWVNHDGHLVMVIRDRILAADMLKNINFMRVMLDEEGESE